MQKIYNLSKNKDIKLRLSSLSSPFTLNNECNISSSNAATESCSFSSNSIYENTENRNDDASILDQLNSTIHHLNELSNSKILKSHSQEQGNVIEERKKFKISELNSKSKNRATTIQQSLQSGNEQ